MEIEAGDQYFHVILSYQLESGRIRSYEPLEERKINLKNTENTELKNDEKIPENANFVKNPTRPIA